MSTKKKKMQAQRTITPAAKQEKNKITGGTKLGTANGQRKAAQVVNTQSTNGIDTVTGAQAKSTLAPQRYAQMLKEYLAQGGQVAQTAKVQPGETAQQAAARMVKAASPVQQTTSQPSVQEQLIQRYYGTEAQATQDTRDAIEKAGGWANLTADDVQRMMSTDVYRPGDTEDKNLGVIEYFMDSGAQKATRSAYKNQAADMEMARLNGTFDDWQYLVGGASQYTSDEYLKAVGAWLPLMNKMEQARYNQEAARHEKVTDVTQGWESTGSAMQDIARLNASGADYGTAFNDYMYVHDLDSLTVLNELIKFDNALNGTNNNTADWRDKYESDKAWGGDDLQRMAQQYAEYEKAVQVDEELNGAGNGVDRYKTMTAEELQKDWERIKKQLDDYRVKYSQEPAAAYPYDEVQNIVNSELAGREAMAQYIEPMLNDPDFKENSQPSIKVVDLMDAAWRAGYYTYDDIDSLSPDKKAELNANLHNPDLTGLIYWVVNGVLSPAEPGMFSALEQLEGKGYDLMTPTEAAVFTYHYNNGDVEKAFAYLGELEPMLARRAQAVDQAEWEFMATDNWGSRVFTDVATVAGNLVNPLFAGAEMLNEAITGERAATMNPVGDFVQTARTARENWLGENGLLKDINIAGKNLGQHLYSAGMSMADMAAAIAAAPLTGGSALPIMAAEAAASEWDEQAGTDKPLWERGIKAGLAGLSTALTEKLPLDIITDKFDLKGLGKVIAAGGSEYAEEVAENELRNLYNWAIAKAKGEDTPYEEKVLAYRLLGVENPEAAARGEYAFESILSGVYGAFSGGAMAGAGNVINSVGTRVLGGEVRSAGNANALARIGQAMNEGTESNRLAGELAKAMEKGKKPSAAKLGQLYKALIQETERQYHEEVRQIAVDAVEEELRLSYEEEGLEFPDVAGQEVQTETESEIVDPWTKPEEAKPVINARTLAEAIVDAGGDIGKIKGKAGRYIKNGPAPKAVYGDGTSQRYETPEQAKARDKDAAENARIGKAKLAIEVGLENKGSRSEKLAQLMDQKLKKGKVPSSKELTAFVETVKQEASEPMKRYLDAVLQTADSNAQWNAAQQAAPAKPQKGNKAPNVERAVATEYAEGTKNWSEAIRNQQLTAKANRNSRLADIANTTEKAEAAKPATAEEAVARGVDNQAIEQDTQERVEALTRRRKPKEKASKLVTFTDGGPETTGEFVRVERTDGELSLVVEKDGEKKPIAIVDVKQVSAPIARVLAYAETRPEITATEINEMIAATEAHEGNVKTSQVIAAYEMGVAAGFTGQEAPALADVAEGMDASTDAGKALAGVLEMGYKAGSAESVKAEEMRRSNTGTGRVEYVGVSYMGEVENERSLQDTGVRETTDALKKTLNPSQFASVQALEKISEVSGINMVLYRTKAQKGETLETPNGMFDPSTSTLYLDIDAGANEAGETMTESAILKTASHELTHYIEKHSAKGYAQLRDAMKEQIKAQGKDYYTLITEKLRSNSHLKTRAQAEAEVIADAAEMMLKDSNAAQMIAKNSPTLFSTIKNWFKDFVRRIKRAFSGITATSEEAKLLMKVKDGAEKYLDNLQDIWDNALVEAVGAKQGEGATVTKGEVQYTYGGRMSSKRRPGMGEAMDMAADDIDMETIRQQTGWFRGMDGAWRYEIDDSKATYIEAKADGILKLKNIYRNAELYEAYPELMDAEVKVKDGLPDGANAGTDGKTIKLNAKLFKSADGTLKWTEGNKDTLLHEIQHLIQEEEGFAGGSNISYWNDRIVTQHLQDGTIRKLNKQIDKLWNEQTEEVRKLLQAYDDAEDAWSSLGIDADPEVEAKALNTFAGLTKELREKAPGLLGEYRPLRTHLNAAIRANREMTAQELYKKTAGEIEARDVEARRTLSSEERMGTAPAMDENAVFADDVTRPVKYYESVNVGNRGKDYLDNIVNHIYSSRRGKRDLRVRDALMAITDTTGMTHAESALLNRYQANVLKLEEMTEAIAEQTEIRDDKNTPEKERGKAKQELWKLRRQKYAIERALIDAESEEGYAKLMTTAGMMVRLLTSKDTMPEVTQALQEQIANVTRQLAQVQEELGSKSEKDMWNTIRSLFDQKKLRASAKKLKALYGSKITEKELMNRIVLMQTTLMRGGKDASDQYLKLGEELTKELRKKGQQDNEMLSTLREYIGTITLTEAQRQEINSTIGMREFLNVVRPVVKVVSQGKGGTTLDVLLDEYNTAEGGYNPLLPYFEGYENEGDSIIHLYDLIKKAKTANPYAGRYGAEQLQAEMIDVLSIAAEASLIDAGVDSVNKVMDALMENAEGSDALTAKVNQLRTEMAKAGRTDNAAAWKADERHKAMDDVVKYLTNLEMQNMLLEKQDAQRTIERQVKEQSNNRIKEIINERNVMERNRVMRERIKRTVGWMVTRIRRETDRKNVPQELKPYIEDAIRIFAEYNDVLRVFKKSEVGDIRRIFEELKKYDLKSTGALNDLIEQELGDAFKELRLQLEEYGAASKGNDTKKKTMYRNKSLKTIDEIVQMLWGQITKWNEIFIDGKQVQLSAVAAETAAGLNAKEDYAIADHVGGKLWEAVKEGARNNNLTPIYFFRLLEGNNVLQTLNDDIVKAQREYGVMVAEAKQKIEQIQADHHYWTWKNDDPLEFTTEQGRRSKDGMHDISLTVDEALSIWATWIREQDTTPLFESTHLANGGFVLEGGTRKVNGKLVQDNTPHMLSKADIDAIGKWLTKEQKAYAEALVKYMSVDVAEIGNRASQRMYGIKKFKEEHYFPMRVQRDQMAQSSNKAAKNPDANRIAGAGFSHRRVERAWKPLVIGDFTETAANHVNEMLLYGTFAVPIENFNSILNHNYVKNAAGESVADENASSMTIRALFRQKYGDNLTRYLEKYLADLNGGTGVKESNKLMSLYKRSAVMASISVVIQQPLSIIRAWMVQNPKYYMKAIGKNAAAPDHKEWEQLCRYSGAAVLKGIGGFDMTSTRTMGGYLAGTAEDTYSLAQKAGALVGVNVKGERYAGFKRQAENLLGLGAQKADQLAWVYMWRAAKAETAEKNPGMNTSSGEFLQLAAERFEEVVNLTQVYDSTLVRSQNMRSSSNWDKAVTAFMAEPTLTWNMMMDGWRNGVKTGIKATGIFLLSQVITAAVKSLWTAGRKEDEEKPWLEKYLATVGGELGGYGGSLNVLNLIPYARDVMSLLEGYNVERADITLIDQLLDEAKKWEAGKYKGNEWAGAKNTAFALSNLLGVPMKNIWRDATTGINTWKDITQERRDVNTLVLKHDALKNFVPWADVSNEAYYTKLYNAMVAENTIEAEALEEFLGIQGKSEQTIRKGVKEVIKSLYKAGDLTDEEAKQQLVQMGFAKDQKEAYKTVDEWKEKPEQGEPGYEEYESYSVYNTVREAIDGGNSTKVKAAIEELKANGYTEVQVQSEIYSYAKQQYAAGEMTYEQAQKIAKQYAGKADWDKDDWYWEKKAWDYLKANGTSEGYKKYGDFLTAVETGKNLKATINEYLSHGVDKGTLSDQITTAYRKQYVALMKAGKKTQAANLQARILTAYEALGYDRQKKLKDIQKWLDE